MAEKLTTARVKAIPLPASGQSETYDTGVAGLTLRVSEHGRRTWCLLYRTHEGRKRRLTLGKFPTLSLAGRGAGG